MLAAIRLVATEMSLLVFGIADPAVRPPTVQDLAGMVRDEPGFSSAPVAVRDGLLIEAGTYVNVVSGVRLATHCGRFALPRQRFARNLPPMRICCDVSKALNRSTAYSSGLQKRFGLPILNVAVHSPAGFVLSRLDISGETVRDLQQLEKKLLQRLHVDSTRSRTWFLNLGGATVHPERRLLLTNQDRASWAAANQQGKSAEARS